MGWDEVMLSPLARLLMLARHERRAANGGLGFGWAQLDYFETLKDLKCQQKPT